MASALGSQSRSQPSSTRARASTSPPTSPTFSRMTTATSAFPLRHPHTESPHLKSLIPHVPRRLLVPTFVPKCPTPPLSLDHGTTATKTSRLSGKLTRARADSAPPQQTDASRQQPSPQRSRRNSKEREKWLDTDCRFEIIEEDLQLIGYQIYAVEKWCDIFTHLAWSYVGLTAVTAGSLSAQELLLFSPYILAT